MSRIYSVWVDANAWIEVIANSDADAEQKAKDILISNPFGWDHIDAAVMRVAEGEE